jgi:hypothetical protein
MSDETFTNIMNGIKTGTEVLSTAAQVAAPIVSVFNPAAGAAMAVLAPVAEKFIVTETGVLILWKTDMTKDEMIAALNASKSELWPEPSSIEPVK